MQKKKYEIILYDEIYYEQIKTHLLSICVEEFGFHEWRCYIENLDLLEFQKPRSAFWIALNEQNQVIGIVGLRELTNHIGEIKNLYLNKSYRGTGMASELMHMLFAFAIKEKYTTLQLGTYSKFERAVSFYEKHGFYVQEIINKNEIIYRKELDNSL